MISFDSRRKTKSTSSRIWWRKLVSAFHPLEKEEAELKRGWFDVNHSQKLHRTQPRIAILVSYLAGSSSTGQDRVE